MKTLSGLRVPGMSEHVGTIGILRLAEPEAQEKDTGMTETHDRPIPGAGACMFREFRPDLGWDGPWHSLSRQSWLQDMDFSMKRSQVNRRRGVLFVKWTEIQPSLTELPHWPW